MSKSNTLDLSYTYASEPHSAPVNSIKKYRNNKKENKNDSIMTDTALTLMSDPRVVRGSTHLLAKKIAQSKVILSKSQPLFSNKMNNNNNNNNNLQQRSNQLPRPSYEFIVKPFAHEDINVMSFLVAHEEEYHNKYKTLITQTDDLLPRPDSPLYIPIKIGNDIGTSIDDDTEIFDFDDEVIPLLNVIVNKTIEQSLYELIIEDDINEIIKLGNYYNNIRYNDNEWDRLREKKVLDDNNLNKKMLNERIEHEKDAKLLKYLISGKHIMTENLINYIDEALELIYNTGKYEKYENAILEKEILPYIINKSSSAIEAYDSAHEVIDDMLLSTEPLYHSYPLYQDDNIQFKSLVLTFKRAVNDSNDDTGGVSSNTSKASDSTIMTVHLRNDDTILSISKRIKMEVSKLKKLIAASLLAKDNNDIPSTTEEIDSESSASSSSSSIPINSIIPDSTILDTLPKLLHDSFVSHFITNLTHTTIAFDGYVCNFPLPEIIKIEIEVNS